jgi:FG-GAP-like repeat
MKRGDLRKLYKEERSGLNLEVKICKILFLIFFLLPFKLYSQVPINNFCGYNSSQIDTGFNTILSYPDENNSQSRLLLYSKNRREIALYDFTKKDKIELQNFLSLRTIPSNIIVLSKKNNTFIYSSRKARKVGVFKIVDNKKIFFTADIGFNSYPENLSVSDINNDGKNEALVSGNAFDGLSILFINNNKIFEKKIVQNSIYPRAIFADINNDSLSDIVGFNLLQNTLDFFYNQGDSTFYKARSIDLNSAINNLYALDINKDSYPDIIFSDDNSIHIIFGDFRNSYSNELTLNTDYTPDKLIFGDFNNDGKTDIAYLNYENGMVSIFFAKGTDDFYKEEIYVEKDNLRDIAVSGVKNEKALFGLAQDREFFSISSIKNFSNNSKVVLTPGPSKIFLFNYNKTINYCLIDTTLRELKIVLSDLNSVPQTIYSLPLVQNEDNVLIHTLSANTFGFFCYNDDERLVEFYTINFQNKAINKRVVYTIDGINDLNVSSSQNKIVSIIYTYKLNNKFGVAELKNDNNKFQEQKIFELEGDLISSKILLGNEKVVYFWVRKGDNIRLNKKQLNDPYKEFSLFTKPVKDYNNILNLWTNISSDKNYNFISLINAKKNSFLIFRKINNFIGVGLDKFQRSILNGKFQLARNLSSNQIFGYSPDNNTFYELHADNLRDINFQKVFSDIKISGFAVSELNTASEFLIYLQEGSVINFKKIFQ